jgi:hypothetical protein
MSGPSAALSVEMTVPFLLTIVTLFLFFVQTVASARELGPASDDVFGPSVRVTALHRGHARLQVLVRSRIGPIHALPFCTDNCVFLYGGRGSMLFFCAGRRRIGAATTQRRFTPCPARALLLA